MTEVPNLRNYISRVVKAARGVSAPPLGGTHYAEGLLNRGTGANFSSLWDTITEADGPAWITQDEDDYETFTFLRSGLYNIKAWGREFHATDTAFTLNQEVSVWLDHDNSPTSAPQLVWWFHSVTSGEVTAGEVASTRNDGPCEGRFFEAGDKIRLKSSGPANHRAVMEFYVYPLAFSD